MSLLTTSAASIHQLAAAATLASPTTRPLVNGLSSEEGEVIKSWWSMNSAIANSLSARR